MGSYNLKGYVLSWSGGLRRLPFIAVSTIYFTASLFRCVSCVVVLGGCALLHPHYSLVLEV